MEGIYYLLQLIAPRKDGWEENSRINWEYYRDSFLLPFFGELTITEMNDESVDPAFHEGDCGP
jgi:hypothetical protein